MELRMVQLWLPCLFTTGNHLGQFIERNMNQFGSSWIPSSAWKQSCWSHILLTSNLILGSVECVYLTIYCFGICISQFAYATLVHSLRCNLTRLREAYANPTLHRHKPSKAWSLPVRDTYADPCRFCAKPTAHMAHMQKLTRNKTQFTSCITPSKLHCQTAHIYQAAHPNCWTSWLGTDEKRSHAKRLMFSCLVIIPGWGMDQHWGSIQS